MKNLKKVLALVLVVAMMASFAVGASAAFPDADEINADYATAVDVLTGMGVIGGYTDGTFRPTNDVTRGAFAKMVAFVMTSGKNAPVSYATSAALAFSDVDATATLAPSIGYAVSKGYVNGYPDGTFRSGNPVTGLAAAKILLGALGFDGVYAGTGWDVNVLNDGDTAGLFKGLDTVDLTKNLSREAAAQMIWNAMNYAPAGETSEYVVFADANSNNVVDAGETVYYRGTDAVTALLMKSNNASSKMITDSIKEGSLGVEKFGLKEVSIPDAFGRKSTAYTNGKDGTEQVVYASYEPTAVLTYTTATTDVKIATELGATATKGVELTVITNGSAAGANTVKKGDTPADIGDQGTLVEVYKTAANAYDVIVIDTYVAKLDTANIKAATPATATDDAVPAHIWIDLDGGSDVDAGETFETTAFAKDDVVLYTVANGALVNVVKADSVEGTITAVGASNAYVRVDGKQYFAAANIDGAFGSGNYVLNKAGVYYLDTYGNIIYYTATSSAPIADQYIYVIEVKEAGAKTEGGSDLFGTGATTSAAQAQARVIDLTTGEIKIVDLAIGKNTAGEDVFLGRNGAATDVKVDGTKNHADEKVYKYAEVDGKIALEGVAGETGVAFATDAKSANVKVAGTDRIATSATKVTVVEYTKTAAGYVSAKVTTITGYANFDGTDYSDAIVTVNTTTNVVSDVLVVKAASPIPTSANYAVYKGQGETDAKGTKLAFYVGGEVVEYYAETGFAPTTPGTVYDLTITDGKADGVEKDTIGSTGLLELTVVDGNMVAVGTTVYTLLDTCVIVDKDNEYKADTLSVGDKVYVYGADASHVAFVIIDN